MADKSKGAVVGALMLVAGGIIGAGIALMYAPQSGKKTRKDVSRFGKKMKRTADAVVDEFASSVSEMVETVSERAEDILDKGLDMTHEAKKELVKVLEQGQERLEKQRAKLSKLVG